MPTYEYSCLKCGHTFESVQSMTAPTLTTCPREACPQKKWGKGKVKRGVGGGAGLIFKGSGFYITDYRSEGYKSAEKKDSGSGATPTPTPTPTPASTPAAGSTTSTPAAPAASTASVPAAAASASSGSKSSKIPKK